MSLNIVSSFNGVSDPDAARYIADVEAADGNQPLEFAVGNAINNFVLGCKADGIWPAIKASCILAGARTLAGALVPLAGTAPTNFNFVSGDYNRKTGLVGNGSTKYLDSNRPSNADPQNSHHLSIFTTTSPSLGTFFEIGASNGTEASAIGRVSSENQAICLSRRTNASVPRIAVDLATTTGFRGVTRSDSTTINARANGNSYLLSEASVASGPNTTNVFRRGGDGSGPANGRYAFYSIGEALDLQKLDSRVTALITAFGAAIP